jgi:RNA polymerase sigma-70 factor, ECF subfamily
LKSLKRLRRTDLADAASRNAHPESPEDAAAGSELKDAVARAVMQLPDTQREVLILAHYEHLPLAEIARVSALDLGAVKSRLQRAREGVGSSQPSWARRRSC